MFGTTIYSVDAGHEVEHDGEKMKVEKGKAVFSGPNVYMEHSDYEALKAYSRVMKNRIETPWRI